MHRLTAMVYYGSKKHLQFLFNETFTNYVNEYRVSKIRTKKNNLKLKQKQKQLNASQFHHYAKVQVNYNLSYCDILLNFK